MVTGAAAGIGRAIALALAREGTDLCLLDVDAAKLVTVAEEVQTFGVEVLTTVCDLANHSAVGASLELLRNKWDRLDILINNAGLAFFGPTHTMSAEQLDRLMAVNLTAPLQLIRELLPTLLAQEESHIVNVCSILGLVTMKRTAGYQASKFGLVGFSGALRAEYGHAGLGVTALCPGFVRTAMIENLPGMVRPVVPGWAFTSAERVAARTITAIRRNQGLVVIGPSARVFWWLMRLSPPLVGWFNRERKRRGRKICAGAKLPVRGPATTEQVPGD